MMKKEDNVKAKLYKYIYKKQRGKFKELTDEIFKIGR